MPGKDATVGDNELRDTSIFRKIRIRNMDTLL
jgi:hypothetical protein